MAFHEKAGAATELVGLRDLFLRRQGCQNLRCMVPLTMGDLDLGIIHGFRDPARQVSQPRSEDRSPRDR